MPVFESDDALNPPLHMEGWDDDELIYLSGTSYIAQARVLKPAPWKLQKGQPYALSVEIPFAVLGDFTAV